MSRAWMRKGGMLPKGSFCLGALGEEYTVKLDRLARRWGCETLGEAALELLKDAVDEEMKG